jgi:hypothetical protein
MGLEVVGKIEKVLEAKKGTSKKSGEEWISQEFVVKTDDKYNNLYCFNIFGQEKVDNFAKYNKVGDAVKVSFNVSTNEWQGKYFTSLQAWSVFKETGEANSEAPVASDAVDDLPF